MKLNDIIQYNSEYLAQQRPSSLGGDGGRLSEWEAKGYQLPKFDIKAVREKTAKEPTWVHFGGGLPSSTTP